MVRKGKAVVCRELNKPVVVEKISVEPPKRGEVTVKLAACGVCHSDLSATNGTIALPLPLVLGHEGAGVVSEVGEGVTRPRGRATTSSFPSSTCAASAASASAGRPVLCLEQGKALTTLLDGTPRTRDANGQPLNIFSGCGVDGRVRHACSADNLVKIDPKIPLDSRGAGRLRA